MSAARARLIPFALPLVRPIATARGRICERRGWLLRLEDGDGHEGHGVAMPIDGFGGEDFDACGRALASACDRAAASPGTAGDEWGEGLDATTGAPFARSALSLALDDLRARAAGLPLWQALAPIPDSRRSSVALNGWLDVVDGPEGADWDDVEARVRDAKAFLALKLKVGPDAQRACAAIERVAAVLGPGQRLRIDPNASWSEDAAALALERLQAQPVEYVEQPVAELDALVRLRRGAKVPLAADEAASDEAGLRRVLELDAADVVVMKPMRIGGPRAALALATEAQRAGVGVTLTSILDASIGVRAALAVALALEVPPLACGLATGSLFARDFAAPPPSEGPGRLLAWREPGLGTEIDERALAECAIGDVQAWTRTRP